MNAKEEPIILGMKRVLNCAIPEAYTFCIFTVYILHVKT